MPQGAGPEEPCCCPVNKLVSKAVLRHSFYQSDQLAVYESEYEVVKEESLGEKKKKRITAKACIEIKSEQAKTLYLGRLMYDCNL